MTGEAGEYELLKKACELWQSGRDDGSSLLRGAARVLTGTPHYFQADFIDKYDKRAKTDDSVMRLGSCLLDAVSVFRPRTASEWRGTLLPNELDVAGRGLRAKDQDQQIFDTLRTGEIAMPLWGVSLDRRIAESYGTRFLFLVEGPFRGLPAWRITGRDEGDQEVIAGGRYQVVSELPGELSEGDLVVRLREIQPSPPPTVPIEDWTSEMPHDSSEFLARRSGPWRDHDRGD